MKEEKFNRASIFISFTIGAFLIYTGFAERNADMLQVGFAAIINYWIVVIVTIVNAYPKKDVIEHDLNYYFDCLVCALSICLILASVF